MDGIDQPRQGNAGGAGQRSRQGADQLDETPGQSVFESVAHPERVNLHAGKSTVKCRHRPRFPARACANFCYPEVLHTASPECPKESSPATMEGNVGGCGIHLLTRTA